MARTHASHAWNTGSIPVGATSSKLKSIKLADILKLWRFRLVARTHASHAWNTGSIPVGATSVRTLSGSNFFFAYGPRRLTSLAYRDPPGVSFAHASCDQSLQALSITTCGNYPLGATSVRTLGSNFFCAYVELSCCRKTRAHLQSKLHPKS